MVSWPRTVSALFLILLASLVVFATQTVEQPDRVAKTPVSLPLAAVSGPQRTIVILVKFSDRSNSTTPSQIFSILSSMNNYYDENSYGLLSFQTDITPSPASAWYLMPNTMTYYGVDSAASDNQLVRDALQSAYDAGVNLASYNFAMVVHAGSDEAITHVTSDIHSYTIPGFVFNPAPLTQIRISTSVMAENDPMGVYAHESGHLLGLPDLYDTTGQIDPGNNFIGYWELMALGEWNPNTGNPLIQPGTYPSHMSAWSKIDLGFIPGSRVVAVQSGESANVTVENIELPTTGFQAVKIPIAYNLDGSLTYYLVDMRAKQATYDQYLPFPNTYPNAGLFIYKVNESIPNGSGNVRLIDAHPGGDLNDAAFGPCGAPCVSINTFWDQANYVKIIVTTTTPTAYTVSVDRTSSPPFLLQVNTPSAGVLISVDGVNMTSDSSKQLRLTVRYGPHTVYVETSIPVSLGSTSVQIGLTNAFVGWDDGGTGNPRGISVVKDTVLTAVYRITVEPSFSVAATALLILTVVVVAVTVHRHRSRPVQPVVPQTVSPEPSPSQSPLISSETSLLPRNNGLSSGTVEEDQNPESPKT